MGPKPGERLLVTLPTVTTAAGTIMSVSRILTAENAATTSRPARARDWDDKIDHPTLTENLLDPGLFNARKYKTVR